ncbi:MAG: hypothetical protein Q8Q60_00610 [Candidatus Chromulinivorax sp.]|nr:hypothetical protein [Candidatus Chromulinivorax sp.]
MKQFMKNIIAICFGIIYCFFMMEYVVPYLPLTFVDNVFIFLCGVIGLVLLLMIVGKIMKFTAQQKILFLAIVYSSLMPKLYLYIFGQQATIMELGIIIPLIGAVIVGLVIGIFQACCIKKN